MIDIDVANNNASVDIDIKDNFVITDVDVANNIESAGFSIQTNSSVIDIDTEKRNIGVPYTGTYEVTPLPFAEQELRTANRVMARNVVVHEIPYHETSNPSGITIIIGE